jgi:hypothetical protein
MYKNVKCYLTMYENIYPHILHNNIFSKRSHINPLHLSAWAKEKEREMEERKKIGGKEKGEGDQIRS